MKKVIITLVINGKQYRFITIIFSKKDQSYYIYQHIKDETSPLLISKPVHLLKTVGKILLANFKKTKSDEGNYTHLSIHPTRIYVKKRKEGAKEEHLIQETEPQPFNNSHFRLHCVITPPPPSHLPLLNIKKAKPDEVIDFGWSELVCPQVSVYEIREGFNKNRIKEFWPDTRDYKILKIDDSHPTLLLHLKATQGTPGIWASQVGIFGKILKQCPLTKGKLQEIIKYNNLHYDISSIPDDAVITDVKSSDNP